MGSKWAVMEVSGEPRGGAGGDSGPPRAQGGMPVTGVLAYDEGAEGMPGGEGGNIGAGHCRAAKRHCCCFCFGRRR
jgi:hypothetical protein